MSEGRVRRGDNGGWDLHVHCSPSGLDGGTWSGRRWRREKSPNGLDGGEEASGKGKKTDKSTHLRHDGLTFGDQSALNSAKSIPWRHSLPENGWQGTAPRERPISRSEAEEEEGNGVGRRRPAAWAISCPKPPTMPPATAFYRKFRRESSPVRTPSPRVFSSRARISCSGIWFQPPQDVVYDTLRGRLAEALADPWGPPVSSAHQIHVGPLWWVEARESLNAHDGVHRRHQGLVLMKSGDRKVFEVGKVVTLHSHTIRRAIKDDRVGSAAAAIPLPNVKSVMLGLAVGYFVAQQEVAEAKQL
ncbi:hypothetical protein Taro_050616 [Colocasia esculenta]|uniref:SKP1 component POZ domain-containing protein n=1 Tax=Colocasia esculenta TaxID=4460 RepID=A0A843XEI5_COLES|nr:hypothetical protein [Colocasia esculenta]